MHAVYSNSDYEEYDEDAVELSTKTKPAKTKPTPRSVTHDRPTMIQILTLMFRAKTSCSNMRRTYEEYDDVEVVDLSAKTKPTPKYVMHDCPTMT